MIHRDLSTSLLAAAAAMPAVTVTGPRQSGKTTLCRTCFPDLEYVNLEIPETRNFALEDPISFLAQFPDGAILDEIQRCPDLLSYIQGRIDEDQRPGRWILTGSQNLLLLDSVSQSLAGRTAVLNLLPLSYPEIERFGHPQNDLDLVLLAGGYPRIPDQGISPKVFLDGYIATYVERDLRSISRIGDLVTFQRFLALCAGRTGQLLNISSLGADCGISQPTAKSWLSILETSFIATRLPAWHGNLRKRLIKAPKLHFWDSGLVCRLLSIRNTEQLRVHPLRGAIFESWVFSEMAKARLNQGEAGRFFHFRDHHGCEVDLIEESPAGLRLVEIKAGQTVVRDMWRGLDQAVDLLSTQKIASRHIVYGGNNPQQRLGLKVVPWRQVHGLTR